MFVNALCQGLASARAPSPRPGVAGSLADLPAWPADGGRGGWGLGRGRALAEGGGACRRGKRLGSGGGGRDRLEGESLHMSLTIDF